MALSNILNSNLDKTFELWIFTFVVRFSSVFGAFFSPILLSLGDTIQVLSILQNDEVKGDLIRKLIIKICLCVKSLI